MSTALMLASISDLRRMAVDLYVLIEAQAKNEVYESCKKYFDALQWLIEVLKVLVESIKSVKHIALLDEPWDEILLRLSRNNYISIDEKDKIVEYIINIVKYLEKLKEGKNLNAYEMQELKKFLITLISVPMMYENKILKELRP